MKRIPSLRTNRAEREGSGRQQQEPRRSVTYSRSIRPNESKRAGNGNARNRGENPFAGNALSFVLLLNHHERIGDDDDLSSRAHNGQPNQKCIAAESSSINGRGGEGGQRIAPPPFVSFSHSKSLLVSCPRRFSTFDFCLCVSSRRHVILRFWRAGRCTDDKRKGTVAISGRRLKRRASVRPSRPGAYYTMEADGGGVSSSCVNNRYDGIAAATPNGRQLSIVVRRRWMKSCGRKEKLRRGGLPWRNGRLSLSLFYLIHSLLCPNSFCLFQVRTLAVLGLTGKRERDSWLLLAHSRQHAVVRNELSRRRRRWEEENIPSLIGIRRQWRPSWTRHRRPMQIYIRVAPSRNYWNI